MICLSIRELCISRHKNGASFTLEVPELEVKRGEILAIVGQSGCGVSRVMNDDVIARVTAGLIAACMSVILPAYRRHHITSRLSTFGDS